MHNSSTMVFVKFSSVAHSTAFIISPFKTVKFILLQLYVFRWFSFSSIEIVHLDYKKMQSRNEETISIDKLEETYKKRKELDPLHFSIVNASKCVIKKPKQCNHHTQTCHLTQTST